MKYKLKLNLKFEESLSNIILYKKAMDDLKEKRISHISHNSKFILLSLYKWNLDGKLFYLPNIIETTIF